MAGQYTIERDAALRGYEVSSKTQGDVVSYGIIEECGCLEKVELLKMFIPDGLVRELKSYQKD